MSRSAYASWSSIENGHSAIHSTPRDCNIHRLRDIEPRRCTRSIENAFAGVPGMSLSHISSPLLFFLYFFPEVQSGREEDML